MRFTVLLLFIATCFTFVIKEIDAVESNDDNRTKVQAINVSFRECVRNCVKADSREAKTECTLQCTRKYRLHPKNPAPTSAAS